MAKIKWEDPAPVKSNTGRTKWADVAEQLRERPDQWALVAEGLKYAVYSTYISKGRLAAFEPAGHYEGTSRKRPDGMYDIYARYVGK